MKWCLDFGHGGKDPGAMGSKLRESDMALTIGMRVKANLEKACEKVVTTREDDTYYSLGYRSSKANSCNCDYFVSIHLNAATSKSAKGCEVWVYDEKSKLYGLSKDICENLSSVMNTPNRGVKVSKKFAVLKNTKMPALLIEVDFISNPEVEARLCLDSYVSEIADSISCSLLGFVGKSVVYRVCVGSFGDMDSAVVFRDEVRGMGYGEAYVFEG